MARHGAGVSASGIAAKRFCSTVGLDPTPPVTPEVVCLFLGFLTVYRRVERATGQLGTICLALSQPPAASIRDLALVLLVTDSDLNLGPGQVACLERTHIQLPDTPLDPAVLLVGRRGGPALHPVELWPNPLPDICPVRALTALLQSHDNNAVFANGDGPVSLEGVVWITTSLVRHAGLTPAGLHRRVPRLDTDQRLQLTAAFPPIPTPGSVRSLPSTTGPGASPFSAVGPCGPTTLCSPH